MNDLESKEHFNKIVNSWSYEFFWTRLASFGQQGLISDPNINIRQEDHDEPISLTWPNRFAYLLLKIQPSSLL